MDLRGYENASGLASGLYQLIIHNAECIIVLWERGISIGAGRSVGAELSIGFAVLNTYGYRLGIMERKASEGSHTKTNQRGGNGFAVWGITRRQTVSTYKVRGRRAPGQHGAVGIPPSH